MFYLLNAFRVKYEDPQASKGLAGALDARQQNTGAVSGHRAFSALVGMRVSSLLTNTIKCAVSLKKSSA